MNLHDSGRFCTESLESAAKRYKTLDFSIIPLNGARNPQQPKLPLIKWARFQHTHPSDEELHSWFGNQPNAGIGIVCGRISRLMVLDFDSAEEASEFRRVCPDLVDTFTVRSGTRKLPHFYYRLPEDKLIPTCAYPGVDLRGEGSYIVAPPTCVGESVWSVENGVPIYEVSEYDMRRIMRFLATRKAEIKPSENVIESEQISEVSEFRRVITATELIAYYRQHCGNGRNHALFQTALLARDTGRTEVVFTLILASVHASEPGDMKETIEARYAEAIRTIASAYSRPARQKPINIRGLGNTVREWFLGNGLANVARVIDGLYAVGMKANELFTEFEACQKLAALKIGRRSIMAALKSIISDWRLFDVAVSPLNPPRYANAANGSGDLNNSCEMSRGAKRVKNSRGRPARLYQLPSSDLIAARIGVRAITNDALSNQDFGSSKAYRQALHVKLINRRPGHYGRAWLSTRLGVSRWTARRYEKAAHIQVQPTYSVKPLSWKSAAVLPQTVADAPNGVFIEVADGKRYPAIRGLALRLLKLAQMPVLKHQEGNFYSVATRGVGIPTLTQGIRSRVDLYHEQQPNTAMLDRKKMTVGIPTPQWLAAYRTQNNPTNEPMAYEGRSIAIVDVAMAGVGIPTLPEIKASFWLCPHCLNFHITTNQPSNCSRCGVSCEWEIVSPAIWRDAQALKHWWQRRYREHQQLKHQYDLASSVQVVDTTVITESTKALTERLHHQIPNLSFANARRLVQQFSEQLIEEALAVVSGRGKLQNPAGFLVTFLRSEHNLISLNKQARKFTEEKKGESSMQWLRRLAQSEYVSFISNADDLLNLHLDQPMVASQA